MTKYVRVKLSDDDAWWENPVVLPLCVDGATPEFTGLLDHDGCPIVRLPRPIGFGREDEW